MFVDQRWIDLTPSLFDVRHHPGPGLERRVLEPRAAPDHAVRGTGSKRRGVRCGSSITPASIPIVRGSRCSRLRTRACDSRTSPWSRGCCERYARRLIEAGYRAHSRLVYGFAHTATGLALDQTTRRLYRRELMKAERRSAPEPPNPFEPAARDDFESWLRDPAGSSRCDAVPARRCTPTAPALQAEFRDLDGAGGRALLWWALTHGVKNGDVLPRLLEPETIDGVRTAPGVNVAGCMRPRAAWARRAVCSSRRSTRPPSRFR